MEDVFVYYPPAKKARVIVDNTQDWKKGYLRKIKPGNQILVQRTKKIDDAIKAGKLMSLKFPDGKLFQTESAPPFCKVTTEYGTGIYIPGEVISSKNSKRAFGTSNKATGKVKAWVTKSSASQNYEASTEKAYEAARLSFHDLIRNVESPYIIQFKFFRSTFADFDFANMVQVVQDMMVKNDWIEDDHCRVMIPVPDLSGPWEKRESSPGVLISLAPMPSLGLQNWSCGINTQKVLSKMQSKKKK